MQSQKNILLIILLAITAFSFIGVAQAQNVKKTFRLANHWVEEGQEQAKERKLKRKIEWQVDFQENLNTGNTRIEQRGKNKEGGRFELRTRDAKKDPPDLEILKKNTFVRLGPLNKKKKTCTVQLDAKVKNVSSKTSSAKSILHFLQGKELTKFDINPLTPGESSFTKKWPGKKKKEFVTAGKHTFFTLASSWRSQLW